MTGKMRVCARSIKVMAVLIEGGKGAGGGGGGVGTPFHGK